MNRREFLQVGAAGLALGVIGNYSAEFGDMKKRVGLIGSGWYGKCDLLRLIQVAPVEVVSLCDVDKRMLSDAADLVATRQVSKRKPRTYTDFYDWTAPARTSMPDPTTERPSSTTSSDH